MAVYHENIFAGLQRPNLVRDVEGTDAVAACVGLLFNNAYAVACNGQRNVYFLRTAVVRHVSVVDVDITVALALILYILCAKRTACCCGAGLLGLSFGLTSRRVDITDVYRCRSFVVAAA